MIKLADKLNCESDTNGLKEDTEEFLKNISVRLKNNGWDIIFEADKIKIARKDKVKMIYV